MSTIFIIIVNVVVPLLGIFFLGWRGGVIAALYAIETAFIGIINIIKMLWTKVSDGKKTTLWVEKMFLIPFFIIHYGVFTLVQGSAIIGIGISLEKENLKRPYFGLFFTVSLLGILIEQCFKFWRDFVKPKAYLTTSLSVLMFQPYSRIMLQQSVVIFGLFMVLVLKWDLGMAFLLILLKTILELSQNKR